MMVVVMMQRRGKCHTRARRQEEYRQKFHHGPHPITPANPPPTPR